MTVFQAFNRKMLSDTFAEVKQRVPEAKANDIGVCRTGDMWTGELNRPCYGEHFHWFGKAEDAWHAKQQTWAAWLIKNAVKHANRGRASKPGKLFLKDPCRICGKMISNCGFASFQHNEMHRRQGK